MSEVLKEVAVTLDDTSNDVLFYIRQYSDGKIVFISGRTDVVELSPEFKEDMIEFVRKYFNPGSKEVKV